MTPPAYHLRTNKAIDRLMFLEAIRRLAHPSESGNYTYYGFGGPYLDDFRLLHENFPDMRMVSVEKDGDVYKRQAFHVPSAHIKRKRLDLKTFLANYEARDRKSIFWLDYTGLEYSQFEEFILLLTKVAAGSMIKITLRAKPSEYHGKAEQFQQKFSAVLPSSAVVPPSSHEGFAKLLQDMLQIASQQALPTGIGVVFQPVCSFHYRDGVGIFTLAGVVCAKEDRKAMRERYEKWSFANLRWAKPRKIDVPYLSTKERLHLQQFLPCQQRIGSTLIQALGYKIDSDRSVTLEQMKQYGEFYLQYPHFIRAYF